MIGWLYRILVGNFHSCPHEWETKEEQRLTTPDIEEAGKGKWSQGAIKYLCCKKCGEWRRIVLR